MHLFPETPESFAELVALLASIDDWAALSKGEQLVVIELADHLLESAEQIASGVRAVIRPRRGSGLSVDVMSRFHGLVRESVSRLLDNGRCEVPFNELSTQIIAVRDTDALEVESVRDHLLMQLLLLLQSSPLPFVRCRQCSRVIVRGPKLNREFCSVTCRNRWHEARRPPRHQVVMTTKSTRHVKLKPKSDVKGRD